MTQTFEDSYFFDAELALETARQRNRVTRTIAVDGLQICYLGIESPLPDVPENLIQIARKDTLPFFVNTRLRLPTKLVLTPGTAPHVVAQQSNSFKQLLALAQKKRLELANIFAAEVSKLQPTFEPGKPLRVFGAASRLTTVMQYGSRDFLAGFNDLGHLTKFVIEHNDMEELHFYHILKEQLDFKPHLTISINHQNNSYLHPEVFAVSWWQDRMPKLHNQEQMSWRDRDLVFSYTKIIDELLNKCGAVQIKRQGFCIDTNLFSPEPKIERQNKVVFIGSGVPAADRPTGGARLQAFNDIVALLAAGEPINEERCHAIAAARGTDPDDTYWRLFYFAIRRDTVRWLCQQTELPVEIYGRYWDEDEVVSPFYQGEVPHGEKVAAIYRSAKYALVCHPFEIQSQRLAEAAACGCIPIVLDSRHAAQPPYWDDDCLFFKTAAQLHSCLSQTIATDVESFTEYYSFKHYAAAVVNLVNEKLNCD